MPLQSRDADLERAVVEDAERECEAQVQVVRALGTLRDVASRRRVMEAVVFLMQAEDRVPGVLELIAKGKSE